MPGPGFGNDFAFLQQLIPIIVIGVFAFVIIKNSGTWMSNSAQPVETVNARVVVKRSQISASGGWQNMPVNAHTYYFVTFEFDDGSRLEFKVRSNVSGLIAEDDVGMLTHQGTRFIRFDRM